MDELMKEAHVLVNGERQDAYGRPEDSFAAIADVWTGLLRNKLQPTLRVDAKDVALLMTGLKLARETNQCKRDNVVDAHGYLALLARIVGYV